jgi:hypothetical protein
MLCVAMTKDNVADSLLTAVMQSAITVLTVGSNAVGNQADISAKT